jgi:multiple sugar transport system permease protein
MKIRYIFFKAMMLILLSGFVLVAIVPVLMTLTNSLKSTLDIKVLPPKFIFEPTTVHVRRILSDGFLRYFINSIVITGTNTVISVFFGVLAAYGFWICKSKKFFAFSNTMILARMVPPITVIVPYFLILTGMKIIGTYIGPILAHAAINLPFVIWLMLGFMRDISKELVESGRIDGCSRMGIFFRIIMPLLSPAIGSSILLVTQYSWNELLFSLQTTNLHTYPLTVGLARYVGAMSVDWGKSSAAASITMVPIIILGFFMQKYMVRGLTMGSVKG